MLLDDRGAKRNSRAGRADARRMITEAHGSHTVQLSQGSKDAQIGVLGERRIVAVAVQQGQLAAATPFCGRDG